MSQQVQVSMDMWPNFFAKTFSASGGHVLPYRFLVPPGHGESSDSAAREPSREPMPLVLTLHGAGECGEDNSAQLRNGVAELLGSQAAAARFPCLYVVPQCACRYRWVERDWRRECHDLPADPSVPLSTVVELLEELRGQYPIDPRRIYLVGLSMGGFGVWDLLSRWPDRFAAAVVICGGADENAVAAARNVPVWVFHGAADVVVPLARSRNAVDVLQAAGGTANYTEYPGVGHDSWVNAFAEPDLLPWLFSHRRPTV